MGSWDTQANLSTVFELYFEAQWCPMRSKLIFSYPSATYAINNSFTLSFHRLTRQLSEQHSLCIQLDSVKYLVSYLLILSLGRLPTTPWYMDSTYEEATFDQQPATSQTKEWWWWWWWQWNWKMVHNKIHQWWMIWSNKDDSCQYLRQMPLSFHATRTLYLHVDVRRHFQGIYKRLMDHCLRDDWPFLKQTSLFRWWDMNANATFSFNHQLI